MSTRRWISAGATAGIVVASVTPSVGRADHTPEPTTVAMAGSLQQELGCPGDWQPECAATELSFDAVDDVWRATFAVPAGNWEYKAALNDSWDEAYPAANLPLAVAAESDVTFFYDHETHWATDDVNSTIATAAGDFQSELGCPGDWQPDCLRSWMQDIDGDDVYEFSTDLIPGGDHEFKVALGEAWDTSYPAGNVPFTSADGDTVAFSFDLSTNDVAVTVTPAAPPVTAAAVAGDFQSELGCPGDWQPECSVTELTNVIGDVFRATYTIPAGDWNYKVALNDTWDVAYPAADVSLALAAETAVTFYFDAASTWVADSVNDRIVTAPGDYQAAVGCPADWQPDCLLSWMQDPDGDETYTLTTDAIPAGAYEAKAAIGEAWDESYPADNLAFTVTDRPVTFTFVSSTNEFTIDTGGSGGTAEPGDELLVRAPVREAAADDVFYFVMPDRFDNGDPTNDSAGDTSGDPLVNGFDPTHKGFYHGGDLAGLTARLPYLDDLGVSAVWLTPQFTNRWVGGAPGGLSAGYHGYWQIDYSAIDPHFGTNAEMTAFVDAAHTLGIDVYFDIVANHTGDVITYEEVPRPADPPYISKSDSPYLDATGAPFDDSAYAGTGTFPAIDPAVSFPYTPSFDDAADATVKSPSFLNDPANYHNRGNSTFSGENSLYGDFFGLDDLWTEKPGVQDGLIQIFKDMVTDFDVDGFRIDTVKHVNDEFWQAFGPELRSHASSLGKDDFFMFGEVFDFDVQFLSRFSTELPLDATLDFAFQGTARNFASQSGPTNNVAGLYAADDYYTDADSNAYALPLFLGNHDIGRVGLFLGQDNGGADDAELVARDELAHALMYFGRGIPVVYYGDEQGFVGDGGDQDARQDMMPSAVGTYNDDDNIGTTATPADDNFDGTHPLYRTLADFGALLNAHPTLTRGAQLQRYSEPNAGILAFSRIERSERVEYVVALNNSEAADSASFVTDSPSTSFTELWPGTGPAIASDAAGNVTVDVPGLGIRLYRADRPTATPSVAPVVTMTAPAAGADVLGRVEVAVSLSDDASTEVTFAVSTDDGATFTPIGTDDNAPYRVFYDVSDLAPGTPLVFKAIADNGSGAISSDKIATAVGEETTPTFGGFDYAIVHYQRPAGDYGDHVDATSFEDYWGLHLWGDAIDPAEATEWTSPGAFEGEDEFGRFAWIRRGGSDSQVNFIIHRGDAKDTPNDRFFDADAHPEIWINQDDETIYTSQADAQGYATIRYHRDDGDYGTPSPDFTTFWGLHLWGDAIDPAEGTDWTSPKPPDGVDDYGAYWTVDITDSSQPLNFIIHRGDAKDPGPDESFVPAATPTVWKQSGDAEIYPSRGAAEDVATIHYHRDDADYGDNSSPDFNDFWGLHVWDGSVSPTQWPEPVRWTEQDVFGPVFEVPVVDGAPQLAYIVHRGDQKDPGPDQFLSFDPWGYEVWQLSGENPSDPATPHYVLPIVGTGAAPGDIDEQRAHWVDEDTIVWAVADDPSVDYSLCHSPVGGLTLTAAGIDGGTCIVLTPGAPFAADDGFLHLDGLPTLTVPAGSLVEVPTILTGQIAVQAVDAGVRVDATGLQIPGVLDDLYATDTELGVVWDAGVPTIKLWAPTAKTVTLHLFDDADPATTSSTSSMTFDPATGIWSTTGNASWDGNYYLFEVEVFVPATGAVETNVVTDPYSVSLSMNSTRSQIVDLDEPTLEPPGWDGLAKPDLARPEDVSIYELHVRDFSIFDETVEPTERGTFAAFTDGDSNGMQHLAALADAGLSHVHLLPTFDIATINENPAERVEPDPTELATYPADSEQQQAAVTATADLDGFNWGYDPYHYTTPEGSYSTDPNGTQRIVEFRQMVQSLNETGLRVVMDVVYNHTNSSGQAPTSVLDRIVPGYYHRLDESGTVATSTCCANTATEHEMMGKLMIDSVVTWAKQYKVDGFRFDLMGHHSKQNLLDLRAALDDLTVADDGVDGSSIYLYGEGWNFGEVADDARFEQATQLNMAGTGTGTFSDRLRDAVRGGGPFDDGQSLLDNQGYVNGLWYDSNGGLSESTALNELLLSADQIRVGLAGNLASYEFVDRTGATVTGAEVDYNGSPAGYTADPQENIVYIAAHDNQTLFDIGQYHHPVDTTMAERVRAQNVGNAIVALSQGVPFLHAGQDMLRSKSLDRDSFNSGDWFNRLDFTYRSNNFGVGLPVAEKNESNWPIQAPILANADLVPDASDIELNVAVTREWLQIRQSSPLFRLETADEIQRRLSFGNTGADQTPGLIVMSIRDDVDGLTDLDAGAEGVIVVFNPTDESVEHVDDSMTGAPVVLHPVLAESVDATVRSASFDPATGAFSVPARTAAVFVDAGPDATPPVATAELTPIAVGHKIGWFRVGATCTDDRGDVTTDASLNGFAVDDHDLVLLITARNRNDHVETPWFHIFTAPEFELTVTCTDGAGNVSTASAFAEFRRGRWHDRR